MQQLFLKFPIKTEYLVDDFFVSQANNQAFDYLCQWPNWGDSIYAKILLLYGECGSGKTHLVHIWQNLSSARILSSGSYSDDKALILEDIDNLKQEYLLHLINLAQENGQYLLLTASVAPVNLFFKLADLRSRILAIPSVSITIPDQDLLKAVLLKELSDRQLKISPVAMDYIIPRIERSFSKLLKFIDKLDRESKRLKHPPTIPLIKQVLERESACIS